MSYELKKPYSNQQRVEFLDEYKTLSFAETDLYLFALEANEIMGEKEIEIDVPDYDEEGNPIMIEVEETITVIDYDEEGNPIGEHEETITKQVQQTHKEKITIPYPVVDPNYEEKQAEIEKERIGNLQITKRVFMLGLQQLGITYIQLKELIATNEQAQMEWDLCVELQRKNPLLDIMASQLGVSSETLDYIFRKANGEDVEPPINEE